MTLSEPRRVSHGRRPAMALVTPFVSDLPRWARVADAMAIALVAVGVTVAASGGFRLRAGAWRFALTSPWRPLLLAAAVASVRHALVREQPIHRHATRRLQGWAQSIALRAAAAAFGGTRPAVFAAGL